MSDEIVAAIISALVSGLVSSVAIFVTVRSSREQREHEAQLREKQEEFERATSQAQHEHEVRLRKRQEAFEQSLELEKNRLSKAQEEEKARRDYEYEARKHLYSEIQPLLFQLKELSESAYRWVISLARTARQGQLSWLSKGYYLSMTIYRFTAPLAVFRLIHGRLTIVDFSVDQPIRVQYNIAKQSYLSISDGFSIARAGKDQGIDLDYEPHEVQRRRRREPSIPSVHAQQHLFRGHLDKIADALVTREPDGPRCMTYGEFEEQFNDSRSNVHRATRALADGFREFTPQSRPVVWRMLIVQVYFHKALLYTFEPENRKISSPADLLSEEERQELDWRWEDAKEIQDPPDREVLESPFIAAEEYVGKQLGKFFSDDAYASTPERSPADQGG